MHNLWDIVKQTLAEWQDDRVPRLGAALAYYSLFSLAPVLIMDGSPVVCAPAPGVAKPD